jgi:hypothetical protein
MSHSKAAPASRADRHLLMQRIRMAELLGDRVVAAHQSLAGGSGTS